MSFLLQQHGAILSRYILHATDFEYFREPGNIHKQRKLTQSTAAISFFLYWVIC